MISIIVAVTFALFGIAFNNIWLAIAGLIIALFLQSAEIKWLHHHMHNQDEEDHIDGN